MEGRSANKLALRCRCIRWCLLGRVSIDRVHPIKGLRLLPKHGFVVGDRSAETDRSMGKLRQIANNPLSTLHVANTRCNAVATEGHHSISNVKAAKGDCPLQGTNKALKLGNVIRSTLIRNVKFKMVILQQRGLDRLGLLSREALVILNKSFHISLGAIA